MLGSVVQVHLSPPDIPDGLTIVSGRLRLGVLFALYPFLLPSFYAHARLNARPTSETPTIDQGKLA
jgi:hypothetical protein